MRPGCDNVSQVAMFDDTSVVIVCNDNEIKFSSDREIHLKIDVPMPTGKEIFYSQFMVSNNYIIFTAGNHQLYYGYLENGNLIIKEATLFDSDNREYGVNNNGQIFSITTKGIYRSQIDKSKTNLDWIQISPKDLFGLSYVFKVFDKNSILIVSNGKF